MTMEGNLEHEEGGAAKRACQFSTVVKCGWFRRTPVDLESEWLSWFSVSASHQAALKCHGAVLLLGSSGLPPYSHGCGDSSKL